MSKSVVQDMSPYQPNCMAATQMKKCLEQDGLFIKLKQQILTVFCLFNSFSKYK